MGWFFNLAMLAYFLLSFTKKNTSGYIKTFKAGLTSNVLETRTLIRKR